MPSTTPTFALPYPLMSDAPSGPTQMQALAERVETVLKNDYSQGGTVPVTIPANMVTGAAPPVTFPKAYSTPPAVTATVVTTTTNGNSNYVLYADTKTTTGVTIRAAHRTNGTNPAAVTLTVDWTAVGTLA